jgi:hypothetical protein
MCILTHGYLYPYLYIHKYMFIFTNQMYIKVLKEAQSINKSLSALGDVIIHIYIYIYKDTNIHLCVYLHMDIYIHIYIYIRI